MLYVEAANAKYSMKPLNQNRQTNWSQELLVTRPEVDPLGTHTNNEAIKSAQLWLTINKLVVCMMRQRHHSFYISGTQTHECIENNSDSPQEARSINLCTVVSVKKNIGLQN